MTYQRTLTKKGQITIPKKIRDFLKLKPSSRVVFEIEKKEVKIKPAGDILDIAGKFNPKNKVSAVELRKKFEKNYERA